MDYKSSPTYKGRLIASAQVSGLRVFLSLKVSNSSPCLDVVRSLKWLIFPSWHSGKGWLSHDSMTHMWGHWAMWLYIHTIFYGKMMLIYDNSLFPGPMCPVENPSHLRPLGPLRGRARAETSTSEGSCCQGIGRPEIRWGICCSERIAWEKLEKFDRPDVVKACHQPLSQWKDRHQWAMIFRIS